METSQQLNKTGSQDSTNRSSQEYHQMMLDKIINDILRSDDRERNDQIKGMEDGKLDDDENRDDEDILNLLPRKNLSLIEKQFPKDSGLELDEFVKTLLIHLEYDNKTDPYKRLRITLKLIDLFKEIDVNGDETMEWEEFSSYIIELGMIKKDRNIANVIKNYNVSQSLRDTVKHDNEIEKTYFFDKTKQLFVLERDSPNFKVYDVVNFNLVADIPAHKGSILAADCYADENGNDLIVTTSDDLTINFWEASNFSLKQRISTPELQLCVRHVRWDDDGPNFIYTGGSDALIHYYDAKTYKQKGHLSGWNPFFKKDTQQFGHAGPVTDLLAIQLQNTLVSCATDGKICLWDVPTHAYKKDLLGHEKGVFSLDWSSQYMMLFSAGLDHEAYVWNTYVSEKINLLRGHNHPLVGVKVVPGTPQVITADINGMVKIWDIRNFLCVQTLNVNCDELNSFAVTTHPKKRIITGSRNLQFYEYDEPKDQFLSNEKGCLRVLFNEVMFVFITLHPDCVKIWDARNGKLMNMYRDISNADLTSCCLDERERKMIVGDSEGKIYCVNIRNGVEMKKFESHDEQITDLVYFVSGKDVQLKSEQKDSTIAEFDKKVEKIPRLISCSKGKIVKIHDDTSNEFKHCRYKPELHQDAVNGLTINKELGLMATYSDDGMGKVIDLHSFKQCWTFKSQPNEKIKMPPAQELTQQQLNAFEVSQLPEIEKAVYLSPYEYILACDSKGNMVFWAKGESVFATSYKTRSLTNKIENFPISSIAFNSRKKLLILGDHFGNITAWDLSEVITKLNHLTQKKDRWNNWVEKKKFVETQKKMGEDVGNKVQIITNDAFQNKTFTTEVNQKASNKFGDAPDIDYIQESDIIKYKPFEAHTDGITWIEMIESYNSFATSSYDCRVRIWDDESIKITVDKTKVDSIGSLMMEKDPKWTFKIDERKRAEENLEAAFDLLKDIDHRDYKEALVPDRTPLAKRYTNQHVTEAQRKLAELKTEELFAKQNDIGPEIDAKGTIEKDDDQLTRDDIIMEARRRITKLEQASENTYAYFTELDPTEEREVFADEDEEDQDYQILNELDLKTNQTNPVVNKGMFRSSKPMKSKVKLKFK